MVSLKVEKSVTQAGRHGARWLRSRFAGWILAVIAFAESLFLPVLIDPFLVALILANRSRWLYYTVISIVASVAGGTVAYFLGLWFFEGVGQPLLTFYGLQDEFAQMSTQIDASGFIFVLVGALTPIPYKIVALASGFGGIDVVTFLLASVFGRILRLGLVGYAAYAVGPHALPMFRTHLLKLAYVFGFLLISYLLYQWLYV